MKNKAVANRSANFEILRLIAIICVLASHLSVFLGPITVREKSSSQFIFPEKLFSMQGTIGVSLFFLLMGYFTVSKDFAWNKVIKLWRLMVFYAFLDFLFEGFFGGFVFDHLKEFLKSGSSYGYSKPFSFPLLVQSAFPFFTNTFWFMTTYILILLLSPAINQVLNKLTRKQFKILLISVAVVYYLCEFLLTFVNDLSHLLVGPASLAPSLLVYVTGAFFKLFPPKRSGLFGILLFMTGSIFSIGYIFCMQIGLPRFSSAAALLSTNVSFMIYLIAIGFFLIFTTIKIKSENVTRLICSLSKRVLEVYLINIILVKLAYCFFPVLLPTEPNAALRLMLIIPFAIGLVLGGLGFAAIRARCAYFINPLVRPALEILGDGWNRLSN